MVQTHLLPVELRYVSFHLVICRLFREKKHAMNSW